MQLYFVFIGKHIAAKHTASGEENDITGYKCLQYAFHTYTVHSRVIIILAISSSFILAPHNTPCRLKCTIFQSQFN